MRLPHVFLTFVLAGSVFAADFNEKPKQYPFHFVAYGDIRFTNPADSRSSDPARRELLVEGIAQNRPAFVIITGDLVLRGSTPTDWERFDAGVKPLRDEGVRILPTIGNHELAGDPTASAYLAHFPELNNKRWYSQQYGNCAFFLLDSSQDLENGEQWKWLDDGLHHLPKETRFLFIALHHPPITQSSEKTGGGGHSARPQEQKLAELIEAAHARTGLPVFVLAGHVHNYERYEHNGVTYITTGGGGATPYEIERKPDDNYRDAGPTYHFTQWTVGKDEVTFQMTKLTLEEGKPKWETKDSFTVKNKKGPKK